MPSSYSAQLCSYDEAESAPLFSHRQKSGSYISRRSSSSTHCTRETFVSEIFVRVSHNISTNVVSFCFITRIVASRSHRVLKTIREIGLRHFRDFAHYIKSPNTAATRLRGICDRFAINSPHMARTSR